MKIKQKIRIENPENKQLASAFVFSRICGSFKVIDVSMPKKLFDLQNFGCIAIERQKIKSTDKQEIKDKIFVIYSLYNIDIKIKFTN